METKVAIIKDINKDIKFIEEAGDPDDSDRR